MIRGELLRKYKYWIILIPVVLWFATIFIYVINFFGPLSKEQAVWGQFGDYLGGVINPIISIVGLTALLATLWANIDLLETAERQIHEAEKSRAIQVALAINSDIQNYRNSEDVRRIRIWIVELLNTIPDENNRLQQYKVADKHHSVARFLARMNNICWAIRQLPTPERDSILDTIDSNLIAEWNSLVPFIQERRDERRRMNLDDGSWYMKDLDYIVHYSIRRRANHDA